MITFTPGSTYRMRLSSDCHLLYTVVNRTAKFITVEDSSGETKRIGVSPATRGNGDSHEIAYPLGKHSMCPILRAENALTTQIGSPS